jgi:RNA-directed DNA polymerase
VIVYNGGNWNNGSNAGLFNLNLNNEASNSNTNIGSRLASNTAGRHFLKGRCPVHFIWGDHPSFRQVRNGKDKSEGAASRQHSPNVAPTTKQKEIMPKTYNHLWERVFDWENLHSAFLRARQGKRYSGAVLRFQNSLEENLTQIQNQLMWYQWRPGPWHEFVVKEPKIRLIQAPLFADRVVHHALVDVVSPLFEKKFISDSYACRMGKGFHSASKRIQKFVRQVPGGYALQADISSYFPSIDHDALMRIISRTIRDKDVLWLCCMIIKKSGFEQKGIPIGALTSQLFANVYLDQLDHYIKDGLGVKYYCRYMDDFVIIDKDKQNLWRLLSKIDDYLQYRLRLDLNPKTDIFPTNRGIDFCGYRVWPSHILPRKRIIRRARRQLSYMARLCSAGRISVAAFRAGVMSFLGYMRHCSGYVTASKILLQTSVTRGYK